ncbi:hypothetical protein EAF00_008831 [Botryotinia globosa]|nr:hypothetical protein EAF00_008831 [Botryotinia globosa]
MSRKTSRLPWVYMDLEDHSIECKRLFNHERITNEVNTLKLVSQNTTIPVPRLLDYSVNPDGTRYLVTELINGVGLNNLHALGCLVTAGEKKYRRSFLRYVKYCFTTTFNYEIPYKRYRRLRYASCLVTHRYARTIERKERTVEKSPARNSRTRNLQPKALIDWEFAGYYPSGMHLWSGALDFRTYVRCARADNIAKLIRKYVPEDFLEACSQLEDREDFDSLVRSGYFPDPEELRASMSTSGIQKT